MNYRIVLKIVLNIHNKDVMDKLLWILRHFESEGIEIIDYKKDLEQAKWNDEYVEKHWREIALSTDSADLDDDERLYKAYEEYYHEKHSD